MAYFYVKNSLGSRVTGGGTTKLSEAFGSGNLLAGDVYATIALALADTAITNGDFILCSAAHSYTVAASIVYSFPGVADGDGITILSVSDGDCGQESSGAIEYCSGGGDDISFAGGEFPALIRGMTFRAGDFITLSQGAFIQFENCTLQWNDDLSTATGAGGVFVNCTMDCGKDAATTAKISPNSAGALEFHHCTISTSSTGITGLISGASGMGSVAFYMCDISGTGADYIVENFGEDRSADDSLAVILHNTKIPTGMTAWVEETIRSLTVYLHATQSSTASADSEYQYAHVAAGIVVEDEVSIYRDGSTAFPSGEKISLKAVTDAGATQAIPAWFELPTRYAELSNTASDLIRVYILSSASLTDLDVWAIAHYPDGTNKHVGNLVTTKPTDILATGTTLDTNTEAWTGRTAEYRYQIDLDTSGDAGADCVPTIRLYVAKASATIYFDTSVDLV